MTKKKFKLFLLPEKLGICHFERNVPLPPWLPVDNSFMSIVRTKGELSIICSQDNIPGGVLFEKNWRVFKVEGPLGFVMTGIIASLSKPLAEAVISILYVSSYETDHLLIKEKNLDQARKILSAFCEIEK